MRRRSFIAGLSAVPLAFNVDPPHACSLVFVNDRKIAKIVVRSMDLPVSFPERPKLFVFPRGMARSSTSSVVPGIRAKIEGIGSNTVRWTNRFGSVVMVGFDGAATDGLNEKGLAAHALVLTESQQEPNDTRAELPDTHWVQYVLDNFATVNDVVDAHKAGMFRVVAAWSNDLGYTKPLGIHLAVEDTSGDSAIFEYVKGNLVIHHGPEYRVMTNDPTLNEMLVRMMKFKEFGEARRCQARLTQTPGTRASWPITSTCRIPRTTLRRSPVRCRSCALHRSHSAIRRVSRAPRNKAGAEPRPIGSALPT